MSDLTKCMLTADLGSAAHKGGVTFTHDYALHGDEDLAVGKLVELTDGHVTVVAIVAQRDEDAGFWYFEVQDGPEDH